MPVIFIEKVVYLSQHCHYEVCSNPLSQDHQFPLRVALLYRLRDLFIHKGLLRLYLFKLLVPSPKILFNTCVRPTIFLKHTRWLLSSDNHAILIHFNIVEIQFDNAFLFLIGLTMVLITMF